MFALSRKIEPEISSWVVVYLYYPRNDYLSFAFRAKISPYCQVALVRFSLAAQHVNMRMRIEMGI
jgi:hypothetical protein